MWVVLADVQIYTKESAIARAKQMEPPMFSAVASASHTRPGWCVCVPRKRRPFAAQVVRVDTAPLCLDHETSTSRSTAAADHADLVAVWASIKPGAPPLSFMPLVAIDGVLLCEPSIYHMGGAVGTAATCRRDTSKLVVPAPPFDHFLVSPPLLLLPVRNVAMTQGAVPAAPGRLGWLPVRNVAMAQGTVPAAPGRLGWLPRGAVWEGGNDEASVAPWLHAQGCNHTQWLSQWKPRKRVVPLQQRDGSHLSTAGGLVGGVVQSGRVRGDSSHGVEEHKGTIGDDAGRHSSRSINTQGPRRRSSTHGHDDGDAEDDEHDEHEDEEEDDDDHHHNNNDEIEFEDLEGVEVLVGGADGDGDSEDDDDASLGDGGEFSGSDLEEGVGQVANEYAGSEDDDADAHHMDTRVTSSRPETQARGGRKRARKAYRARAMSFEDMEDGWDEDEHDLVVDDVGTKKRTSHSRAATNQLHGDDESNGGGRSRRGPSRHLSQLAEQVQQLVLHRPNAGAGHPNVLDGDDHTGMDAHAQADLALFATDARQCEEEGDSEDMDV